MCDRSFVIILTLPMLKIIAFPFSLCYNIVMNKFEFKEALKRGSGRAYIALQEEDKGYFRSLVQWGCLHVNTCNTQDEGFLDAYVYRLVKSYDDPESFLPAVADRLIAADYDDDTDEVRYLAKLATRFALDGSRLAAKAIRERYKRTYDILLDPDREVDWIVDYDLEVFCSLASCVLAVDGEGGMTRVATNVGSLIRRLGFSPSDFDWIYQDIYFEFSHLLPHLATLSGRNADAFAAGYGEAFMDIYEHGDPRALYAEEVLKKVFPHGIPQDGETAEEDVPSDEEANNSPDDERLKYEASDDDVAQPKSALSEVMAVDIKRREALHRLSRPYSTEMPFSKLLPYLHNIDPEVRTAAENVLTKRRDDAALDYAKSRIAACGAEYCTVTVLLRNYREDMLPLLLRAVRGMDVEYREGEWHGVVLSMLYADEEGGHCPTELLLWAYENCLCRHCRHNVMEMLYARGALTERMENECYYDAYPETVEFAEKHSFRRYEA